MQEWEAQKQVVQKERAERGVKRAEKCTSPLLVTQKIQAKALYPSGAEGERTQRPKKTMVQCNVSI